MARAVLKLAFAALLALFSPLAIVPSARDVASIEIVFRTEAEQQTPREAQSIQPGVPASLPAPTYVSRTKPEPDTARSVPTSTSRILSLLVITTN